MAADQSPKGSRPSSTQAPKEQGPSRSGSPLRRPQNAFEDQSRAASPAMLQTASNPSVDPFAIASSPLSVTGPQFPKQPTDRLGKLPNLDTRHQPIIKDGPPSAAISHLSSRKETLRRQTWKINSPRTPMSVIKGWAASEGNPDAANGETEAGDAESIGTNDLSHLAPDLVGHLPTVCKVLWARYSEGITSTWVGPNTLVSFNPMLPTVPSASILEEETDIHILGPGFGEIALKAIWYLRRRKENQVIYLNGESGSGKTTAMQHIVQQLLSHTESSRRSTAKILPAALHLLHAFTACKTRLNGQASRQGHYIRLGFAENARVTSASIYDLCFETSRMGTVRENERNFHILHQLIASATQEERTLWSLGTAADASKYPLLCQKGQVGKLTRTEAHAFPVPLDSLRHAMKHIGLSADRQRQLFKVLAGLLHLSTIEFTTESHQKDPSARCKNQDVLLLTANLLDMNPESLEAAMTFRASLVGETVSTDILTVEDAQVAKWALCSTIYSLLVKHIIAQCNKALSPQTPGAADSVEAFIDVFDIPGAEDIHTKEDHNGFYQLATNFAAEKVNALYLDAIYHQPKQIAALEGITFPENDSPVDLRACVQLIEHPQTGLGALMQQFEASALTNKDYLTAKRNQTDTAVNLVAAFNVQHKASPFFSGSGASMTINHFWQPVAYQAADFLDGNDNMIRPDFAKAMTLSRSALLKKLVRHHCVTLEKVPGQPLTTTTAYRRRTQKSLSAADLLEEEEPVEEAAPAPAATESNDTALQQLTSEQKAVVEEKHTFSEVLVSTEDVLTNGTGARKWFVQCIRPDASNKAWKWTNKKVEVQVNGFQIHRTAAWLASAPMMNISMDLERCFERYAATFDPVLASTMTSGGAIGDLKLLKEGCQKVVALASIHTDDYKIGKTAIFFTESALTKLEAALPLPRLAQYEARRMEDDVEETETNSDVGRHSSSASIMLQDMSGADVAMADVTPQSDRGAAPGSKPPLPNVILTKDRRRWLRWVKFCTFWIPEWTLIKWGEMASLDVRMAWREKVALCCIALWLSAIMIFIILWFGKLLCPTQSIYSLQELRSQTQMFSAINGVVYDLRSYPHTDSNDIFTAFAGGIADRFFPKEVALSSCLINYAGDPYGCSGTTGSGTCYGNAGYTVPACSYTATDKTVTTYCHDYLTFYSNIVADTEPIVVAGGLGYTYESIAGHDSYDITSNSGIGLWGYVGNQIIDWSMFVNLQNLPDVQKGLINRNAGGDTSTIFNALPKAVQTCLTRYSSVGVVDTRNNSKCQASTYSLLIMTILICSITGVKFLMALRISSKRMPEDQDRYVILQVPCYTEDENSLRKTIDSLALLNYVDERKLLFIICDGVIKGAGNDRSTPELVLSILGQEWDDRESHDFISIGDGPKQHNRGKVYSGWYSIQARYIPYVVVVKAGSEQEIGMPKPGNRGKRDSQIIMMKYLNKLHFNKPMLPLELELTRQIQTFIGVDPIAYEYCLMVDADTEVMPDSLNRLIAVMLHDSTIMGLCGETDIANQMDTYITMAQVFEYYISHHLAKAFESMFGNVTCLPGCFCMYRFRTPGDKPQTLLINDSIIEEYQDNKVDTLHKKNLLSLGEDRYLTTLMLKTFPNFKNKFTPDAMCKTVVPDRFEVLLSQRRRWINSTVHNLWELLRIKALCGCLCFSMQVAVAMDFFATLTAPATFIYILYLIMNSIITKTVPTLTLYVLAATYGAQVVIFLLNRQFAHIGWMVISIMAMPLFNFILPAYSFWNFDDFSWGNTRLIVGEKKDTGHGSSGPGDGPVFDPASLPSIKWDDYVAALQSGYGPGDYSEIASSVQVQREKEAAAESKAKEQNKSYPVGHEPLRSAALSASSRAGSAKAASIYSNNSSARSNVNLAALGYSRPTGSGRSANNDMYARASSYDSFGGGIRSDSKQDLLQAAEQEEANVREEAIVSEIRSILEQADLSKITKRMIREELGRRFNTSMEDKRDFINRQVDLLLSKQ